MDLRIGLSSPTSSPFFKPEDSCFTMLCWFLLYTNLNPPWVQAHRLPLEPRPLPTSSQSSRLSPACCPVASHWPPTGRPRHTWCVFVSPVLLVHSTLSCPSVHKPSLCLRLPMCDYRCMFNPWPHSPETSSLRASCSWLCLLHPSPGLAPSPPALFFSTKHFITVEDTLYFACLFCWLSSSLL